MSSKDNDEETVSCSRGDNIKMMINDKEGEFIEQYFKSLLSRYLIGLETSIKFSSLIYDYVNLLQYKCHITLKSEGFLLTGYKTKRATTNSINKKIINDFNMQQLSN